MDATVAMDLFDTWNHALELGDAETVADLYAPDAVLVPTLSPRIRADRAAIIDYFHHFLEHKLHAAVTESHVTEAGDLLLHAGLYTFTCITPNQDNLHDVHARFSFVYRHDKAGWKIIAHHSSLLPA